jgi:hypothetical protein
VFYSKIKIREDETELGKHVAAKIQEAKRFDIKKGDGYP